MKPHFPFRMFFWLVLGLFPLLTVPAQAATLTVANLNDSGVGSLRSALAAANPGDTITFASGVTGTITLQSTLTIAGSVTIIGPGSANLFISGNNLATVFAISGGTTDAPIALSGLTIEDGNPGSEGKGGGVYVGSGVVTFTNCALTSNSGPTSSSGAGLYIDSAAVTVTNCTFTENGEAGFGGGIFNGGALTMNGCTLSGNSAAQGGGVFNTNTVTMTNCALTGNSTPSSTGGVGAGLDNEDVATVIGCTFSGNDATGGVGPNKGSGGAVMNDNGEGAFTNCVFVGNHAGYGAAVDNDYSSLTITNCTVTGNVGGSGQGGGLDDYSNATATLTNNIFYDDTGGEVVNSDNTSSVDIAYCDIGEALGSAGSGYSDDGHNLNDNAATPDGADPLFVVAPGDLHLQPGSSCISAGATQMEAPSGVTVPGTDLSGTPRSSPPSIGAYDGYELVINTTADPDNNVGGAGGVLSLREAVNEANESPGATITFDPTVFATEQTITEALGSFTLSAPMTILGPSAGLIVSAARTYGGFEISGGTSANPVTLNGLTIDNAEGAFGGIQVDGGGYLSLGNCTVTGNISNISGGGLYNNGGATANDCQFTNNASYGAGGGIYNDGTLMLINCVVANNQLDTVPFSPTSYSGAGIGNTANATLVNCTVTANGGTGSGSYDGIQNSAISPYGLVLVNDIVYGNNGDDVYSGDGIASAAYCDIGVGVSVNAYGGAVSSVGGNINAEPPSFVNSPTNLRLQTGSPCLGTGATQADIPQGITIPTTDITGAARPAAPSIGAYDVNATSGGGGSTPPTLAPTVTTLTLSPNPSLLGQTVTINATVTPNPGTADPTGTVTFTVDGVAQTPVAVAGGISNARASFSTSTLAVGSHMISAAYSGDGVYATSASATATQTVTLLPATVNLLSAGNPLPAGEGVQFTAFVTPTGSNGPALTGTVTFTIGSTTSGPLPITNTEADYVTGALSQGTYTVTAAYSGDSNYAATSSTLTEVVNAAGTSPTATTTTLSSSANPSTVGQAVTITATVAPTSGTGTPTGTVTFTVDGTAGSPVTLTNGSATYSSSALTQGSHTITVAYSGDSTNSASSGTLTQIVNAASTSIINVFNPGLQMIAFDENYDGVTNPWEAPSSQPLDTYNGGPLYIPTTTLPQPGHGAWVYLSGNTDVYDTGAAVTGTTSVALTQGWNLIGSPYSTPFPVASLEVKSGGSTYSLAQANQNLLAYTTLYTYPAGTPMGGNYTPVLLTDNLQPFTGYWLYAFRPCTLMMPSSVIP